MIDDRLHALIDGLGDLDARARELFALQVERSAVYRAFCERRGAREVRGWRDVPALPVEAFRDEGLRGFPARLRLAAFLTSGTTDPARGTHAFDAGGLALYRHAAMTAFGPALVPEGGRLPIVSLVADADDSSLARMVRWVIEDFGTPESVIDPSGAALRRLSEPALVIGTAFALADAFEHPVALPPRTRIMETGGFKGRRREVARKDLHDAYRRSGVTPEWVVGEYGMTELSSQWYDGVAGTSGPDADARIYRPPPWARTRVVDPVTLDDVHEGAVGLLWHYDPINRGSAAAVLTGDLGERRKGGFIYRGRATGAALRGCSLTAEPL